MIPSRRNFIAKISFLMAAMAVPSLGWAKKKKKKKKAAAAEGGAGCKLIDVTKTSDPNVKTLLGIGYVAKSADYKKNPANKEFTLVEKMGVKPDDQKCSNCVLKAKNGDSLKCNLVAAADFCVHNAGWCQSWTKG